MKSIKRIGINTGGGDAPGLNAVIHAAVHAAHNHGWEIFGIRDGFDGLLHPENYPNGGLIKLTRPFVRSIAHLGGTILGTSNYGNPFKLRVPQPDGSFKEIDRSDDLVSAFREHRLDSLISIGGDGSLTIARDLNEKGLRVIGVPKTIDNDLESTMTTGEKIRTRFSGAMPPLVPTGLPRPNRGQILPAPMAIIKILGGRTHGTYGFRKKAEGLFGGSRIQGLDGFGGIIKSETPAKIHGQSLPR